MLINATNIVNEYVYKMDDKNNSMLYTNRMNSIEPLNIMGLTSHLENIISSYYEIDSNENNFCNKLENKMMKENPKNEKKISNIGSYKYHSHFLSMIKKGLICFSCGNILKSNYDSKMDIDIRSIQTCPTISDTTNYVCKMDICGRSVCNVCVQFSKVHDVSLFNFETNNCIICDYQSNYNKKNPNNLRNSVEWHWTFHTSEDLMFLRKIRGSLINGNGLHIELSGKRQGCWRRRKDGKRKHFSFKQHGGFFESRAIALDFKSINIKCNNSDYSSVPLMITAMNDNLSIIPRRIQRSNEINNKQNLIINGLNDNSCMICFEKQNIRENLILNEIKTKSIKCIACGRIYCNTCVNYIKNKNPNSIIATSFFNEEVMCILCNNFNTQIADKFALFIQDFCSILPSNSPLIKFDKFNMKWKTPYGSVSIVETGGILEARKEAYKQLENAQNSEFINFYDRNIFYGEVNKKLGYYTQFVKNGILRIYGPFDTYDEAGRRWDLDALKYYGAEKAMRRAFFPKLLTWLSLPQTLQRYFLAPWVVWSIGKGKGFQRIENKFNLNNKIFKSYDIIIIGAGISGLKAAEILLEKNLNVLVLEAQSTFLGRISNYSQWTNHKKKIRKEKCFIDNQIELDEKTSEISEETICISDEIIKISVEILEEIVIDMFHPLSAVLDKPIKEFKSKINGEYFEKVNPTKMVLEKIKKINQVINWRWLLLNYCIPISMKRLNIKNLSCASKKYIERITIGDYGENIEKSLEQFYWERLPRFVGFEEMPWREYWCCPKNNFERQKLPIGILHYREYNENILFDECDAIDCEIQKIIQNKSILENIIFNTAVTDILFNGETDQVNLRVDDGTWYSSSCVICTLPIGVLKKSTQSLENANENDSLKKQNQANKYGISKNSLIKFTPSLPYETVKSIKLLDMNTYTEVYLRLNSSKEEFTTWFLTLDEKIYHLDHPSITIYTNKDIPDTIMCGISPPLSDQLNVDPDSKLNQQNVANMCLKILKKIAPKTLELEIIDFSVNNWKDNPFCYGSIPIHSINSKESNITQLIKPHYEGHLYFAGDGTTVDGFGSIQGALLSAKRAATQVYQFLSN